MQADPKTFRNGFPLEVGMTGKSELMPPKTGQQKVKMVLTCVKTLLQPRRMPVNYSALFRDYTELFVVAAYCLQGFLLASLTYTYAFKRPRLSAYLRKLYYFGAATSLVHIIWLFTGTAVLKHMGYSAPQITIANVSRYIVMSGIDLYVDWLFFKAICISKELTLSFNARADEPPIDSPYPRI